MRLLFSVSDWLEGRIYPFQPPVGMAFSGNTSPHSWPSDESSALSEIDDVSSLADQSIGVDGPLINACETACQLCGGKAYGSAGSLRCHILKEHVVDGQEPSRRKPWIFAAGNPGMGPSKKLPVSDVRNDELGLLTPSAQRRYYIMRNLLVPLHL